MKSRLEHIGEDSERLIEEIAQSFWVEFSWEDIEQARTVGELFDCVKDKMGPIESSRCLTSVAFYRLRGSLAEMLKIDRRSIRPDTKLDELVPSNLRRVWMNRVETELRFRPTGLSKSAWAAICAIGLVCSFVAGGKGGWIVASGFFAIVYFMPYEFSCETFGELVEMIAAVNQGKLRQEAGGSTVKQTWNAFRQLLSGASGLPYAEITREMRFPEDLDID